MPTALHGDDFAPTRIEQGDVLTGNATIVQGAMATTQARPEVLRADQRPATTTAPRRSWWAWRRRRNPKLTVIIPVFNKERYLEECLDSILTNPSVKYVALFSPDLPALLGFIRLLCYLFAARVSNQTLQEFEIICIDDRSTDSSVDILARYCSRDQRIRQYRNKTNLGPGPSRNIGICEARGAYIQFTDADDLLLPSSLEILYSLAANTRCSVVRGRLEAFPEGPLKAWFLNNCPGMTPLNRKRIRFSDEPLLTLPWFHQSYLFSHKFLIANDLKYPAFRDGEDPIFIASVLLKSKYISTTSEICYLYRTDKPFERATGTHVLDFLKSILILKALYGPAHEEIWQNSLSHFYLSLISERIDGVELTAFEWSTTQNLLSQIWSAKELLAAGAPPSWRLAMAGEVA